jgi:hypothetical protein
MGRLPFCSLLLRLRVLLKTVQCFFSKQVRVSLTYFGKLDDLVGDDFVTNRMAIPAMERRADHLIGYAHNPPGFGIE